MARLIDTSYFVREINLPGNPLTSVYTDIQQYIDQYEKQILIALLGRELYKELQVEIDADSYTTKWNRLVNGHEYSVDYQGITTEIRWNGLINDDKISLLSYYVYFYWMKFHATGTTSIGESVTEKENASGVQPVAKMVNAWNSHIDLYGKTNDVVINETAYNFLKEFEDDYDNWVFTPMEKINIFGI